MSVLSKEKVNVLAEKNGWSLMRAKGFVEGEIFRRRGKTPSKYAQIGIDEYCLGFRAGYYERQNRVLAENLSGLPAVRGFLHRVKESSGPVESAMGSGPEYLGRVSAGR